MRATVATSVLLVFAAVPLVATDLSEQAPVNALEPAIAMPVQQPTQSSERKPGLFKDITFSPDPATTSGLHISVESPVLAGFTQLLRAEDMPDKAVVKFGHFYLVLLSASGSALYSDNVDWAAKDPQAGTLAILRLGMAALYELNDNLHLAVAGSLVYLPTKGKVGLSGFGIGDPLYAFSTEPIFRAQLSYDLNVGEWGIRLADEYRITAGVPAPAALGFQFDEDQMGEYVLRDQFVRQGTDDPFILKQNTAGASVTRLLPTETRLTAGGTESLYWYEGKMPFAWPARRDTGFVSLDSERDELRLKPFAYFKVDRYDMSQWDHQQVRTGFHGPLTDNLEIVADGGWFWADTVHRDGALWRGSLSHTLGPLTEQQISYARYLAEPFGDIEERFSYWIWQRLCSPLTLGFNFYSTRFELLSKTRTTGRDWSANAALQAAVLDQGGVEIQVGYLSEGYDSSVIGTRDSWVGRIGVRRRSLQADVIYRHTIRQSDETDLQYRENMVLFTLTKYF